MRILIVGINHQIQRPFWSTDGLALAFVEDQKRQFGEVLREQIQKRRVDFVGEEANHQEESIAEGVCNGERCNYANIEMTSEERAHHKIPPSYNENPAVSEGEKARGNREREDHMVNRTLTEAQGCDSVLVICGSMHSGALAEKFRARGHSVEIDDLQGHHWYVEDWMNHIMHNL